MTKYPTLAKFLEESKTLLARADLVDSDGWYLFVVSDSGSPGLTRHDTPEALVVKAREAIAAGQRQILVFRGSVLGMAGNPSAGCLELVLPDGRRLPILEPAPLSPAGDGFITVRAVKFTDGPEEAADEAAAGPA